MTDGLTVVDLSATPGTAYTLEDPVAADPQAPLGRVPDAVAVDFGLGVAMVAVGQPSSLQVLDLGAAGFDAATLTCAIPGLLAAVTLPSPVYTAVTADPTTHIAMVAEEYGAGVVFIDLAQARTGTPTRLDAAMPLLPGGAPWVTRGDPHGALVGVVAGRPYAFLASRERDWIARIDLLGVAGVMAGTGTFEAQVAYISVPPPP